MSLAGPSQLSLFAAEGDAKSPRPAARGGTAGAPADGELDVQVDAGHLDGDGGPDADLAAHAGGPAEDDAEDGLEDGLEDVEVREERSLRPDVAQYTLTPQRPPAARPPRTARSAPSGLPQPPP